MRMRTEVPYGPLYYTHNTWPAAFYCTLRRTGFVGWMARFVRLEGYEKVAEGF